MPPRVAGNQLSSYIGTFSTLVIVCVISATPDAPKGVTVIEDSPTMLVVSVEPPDNDGGVPIIGYRLTYESVVQDFALGKDKLDEGNMFSC